MEPVVFDGASDEASNNDIVVGVVERVSLSPLPNGVHVIFVDIGMSQPLVLKSQQLPTVSVDDRVALRHSLGSPGNEQSGLDWRATDVKGYWSLATNESFDPTSERGDTVAVLPASYRAGSHLATNKTAIDTACRRMLVFSPTPDLRSMRPGRTLQ